MVWDATHGITFTRHSTRRLVYSSALVVLIICLASSLTWVIPRLTGVGAGRVSQRQLVVIDTDPGVDDAMAILVAMGDPTVNILGLTTVRGNADVPDVTINALKILGVAKNYNVPVYSGNNYGLTSSPPSGNWFGKDGFVDLPFPNPPSASSAQKEHAASFLARIVQEYPDQITILALGPLTNLALALHLNPDFLKQAKRVIVMGGCIKGIGNAASGVEFNFFMDPDAAAVVLERALSSHVPITLMPSETVNDFHLTQEWRWNTLARTNNSVVDFLNKLDSAVLEMHHKPVYTPFDSYAVAAALSPECVTYSRELYGFVENKGTRTQGALMLDYLNLTSNLANLDVVIDVNKTVIEDILIQTLSSFN